MDSIKDLFKRDADIMYDETPTMWQAVAGFLVGFVGYMNLFPLIILKIIIAAMGIDVQTASPEVISLLNIVPQLIGGVITIIIMLAIISRKKIVNILKNFDGEAIKLGLKYFLISYAGVLIWNIISLLLFGPIEENTNQNNITTLMTLQPIFTVMLTCIIAPIIEEFIFRYYLYKGLEKYNPVWAIVITTFLFAFIHLTASFGNGTFLEDLKTLPGYLIPSFVMTVAYYKHHKLAVPFVLHFTNNVFSTIMFFLTNNMAQNAPSTSEQISSVIELVMKCLNI